MIPPPEETLTGRYRFAEQRRDDWRRIGPGTPKARIERTFHDDPARAAFVERLCRQYTERRVHAPDQLSAIENNRGEHKST